MLHHLNAALRYETWVYVEYALPVARVLVAQIKILRPFPIISYFHRFDHFRLRHRMRLPRSLMITEQTSILKHSIAIHNACNYVLDVIEAL